MYRLVCQECEGDLMPIDWLPVEGIDPNLRKFKCVSCGMEEYQNLTGSEIVRFEKKLEALAEAKSA